MEIIQIDLKIKDYIHEHEKEIIMPITAFVTFTNQEANDRAVKYLVEKNRDKKGSNDRLEKSECEFESYGCVLKVTDAPEPSDIIWENLPITEQEIKFREAVVDFSIVFFMIAVLIFFTWLKVAQSETEFKYPRNTECRAVDSLFSSNQAANSEIKFNSTKKAEYKRFAELDFP